MLPDPPQVDLSTSADTSVPAPDDSNVTIEALDTAGVEPDHQVKRGIEIVHRFKVTPEHGACRRSRSRCSATAFNDGIGPILGGARDVVTFRATDRDAKVALK